MSVIQLVYGYFQRQIKQKNFTIPVLEYGQAACLMELVAAAAAEVAGEG